MAKTQKAAKKTRRGRSKKAVVAAEAPVEAPVEEAPAAEEAPAEAPVEEAPAAETPAEEPKAE